MTWGRVGSGLIPDLSGKLLWEEVLLPFLHAWDSVRLRTASTQWNVPERYGPCGELFFFPLEKEPRVLRELIRFGPSISIDTVKTCAWIGLHMMAEKNAWRSDSGSSVLSSSSCEDNVGDDALYVIVLDGSGDTIALFLQEEMHEVERRRGWFGF